MDEINKNITRKAICFDYLKAIRTNKQLKQIEIANFINVDKFAYSKKEKR